MKELFKKYATSSWSVLSEEGKKAVLTQTEEYIAKKEGREPRNIRYDDLKDFYGKFDSVENEIVLNKAILQKAGVSLCVLLHEGRHAYQCDVISNKIENNRLASKWTKNWFGYLDPNSSSIDQSEYYLQPIEKDAWAYSIKELKKLSKVINDKLVSIDLLEISSQLDIQPKRAKILYGRKYMKTINGKIGNAFISNSFNNRSSYPSVMERLSQEGLKEAHRYNLVDNIIFTNNAKDFNDVKTNSDEKKALAAKYGFDAKVVESAERVMQNSAKKEKSGNNAKAKSAKELEAQSASVTNINVILKPDQNQK